MVRYLLVTITVIIALALLLAIFAGSAQARAATPVAVNDAGQVDGTALICLALVGGTALLAGAVWVGMLRRIPA